MGHAGDGVEAVLRPHDLLLPQSLALKAHVHRLLGHLPVGFGAEIQTAQNAHAAGVVQRRDGGLHAVEVVVREAGEALEGQAALLPLAVGPDHLPVKGLIRQVQPPLPREDLALPGVKGLAVYLKANEQKVQQIDGSLLFLELFEPFFLHIVLFHVHVVAHGQADFHHLVHDAPDQQALNAKAGELLQTGPDTHVAVAGGEQGGHVCLVEQTVLLLHEDVVVTKIHSRVVHRVTSYRASAQVSLPVRVTFCPATSRAMGALPVRFSTVTESLVTSTASFWPFQRRV